jgi:two-component system chemotaxis response regulator CheY
MSAIRERHVLAVDDDAAYLSVLKLCMRTCGFNRVHTAADGDSALDQLDQFRVDLIISDWNMEPMDGLDLLQAVRARPWTASTPFILTTASLSEYVWRRAIDLGVSDFLVKPFSLAALRSSCYLACRPSDFDPTNVVPLRPRLAQRRMEQLNAPSPPPGGASLTRLASERRSGADKQAAKSGSRSDGAGQPWRTCYERLRRLFEPAP